MNLHVYCVYEKDAILSLDFLREKIILEHYICQDCQQDKNRFRDGESEQHFEWLEIYDDTEVNKLQTIAKKSISCLLFNC